MAKGEGQVRMIKAPTGEYVVALERAGESPKVYQIAVHWQNMSARMHKASASLRACALRTNRGR